MSIRSRNASYNVIIFGESGVGKSSIVNMLFDKDTVETSDGVMGCTFESKLYHDTREGYSFNIYDTAGLNESDKGKVKSEEAVGNLIKLVKNLKDGIHLLIMCIKKGRINNAIYNNYQLFYAGIFCKSVPIILVVTGCELDEPINSCKIKNEKALVKNFKMKFNDIVCITTLNKGDSTVDNSLKEPWIIPNFVDFFMVMIKRIWNIIANYCNFRELPLNMTMYSIFQKLGFCDTEATEKANKLVNDLKNDDMTIQVVDVDSPAN
ncbi:unnamed protein product [Didymodactylos carnosus]|uniref:G domain-containing protein n=1 Tax=Didymodactylos carnosus TaxID=1234261 RepID=A0A813U7N3_9BILA|nr:unnamed protein product [Didymodactylos carnosus]CAF3609388.1 unnamed protein product [Didymodactylos carnosus]